MCREDFEARKRREVQRAALLKKRRVEVLDIKHNDELQRESDFNSSIDTTTIEVEQPLEDVDENENEALLNSSSSNKKINMKEFHKLLSAAHVSDTPSVTHDNQLFLSFLLATIFYPNMAIGNKSWGVLSGDE